MPTRRRSSKGGGAKEKTTGTAKPKKLPTTTDHGTGGLGSPMAETHVGFLPEDDHKPGLQVIVLVRTFLRFSLCYSVVPCNPISIVPLFLCFFVSCTLGIFIYAYFVGPRLETRCLIPPGLIYPNGTPTCIWGERWRPSERDALNMRTSSASIVILCSGRVLS